MTSETTVNAISTLSRKSLERDPKPANERRQSHEDMRAPVKGMRVTESRVMIALAAGLLIAGCASQSREDASGSPYMKEAYAQFKSHLADCTASHDFDPDNAPGLGENELAPTERAWRACAYEGVERYLAPNSKSPELYRRLVTTDRILTDDIEKGTVTRSARKARIEAMVEEIRAQEIDHMLAEDPRMDAERRVETNDFTRRMVEDLRRF